MVYSWHQTDTRTWREDIVVGSRMEASIMLTSRRALLSLSVLAFLPACTTLHQVSVGSNPGEFYAVAQRSIFFAVPMQSYILHCTEISDPLGKELVCERVLASPEAGQLAPGNNPGGRQKFVRTKKEAQ